MHHEIDTGLLRGLAELERTDLGWLPHRLPWSARAQCDDPQLLGAEAQPAGVRFAFRTAATVIELDTVRTRVVLTGVPERPDGTVDLVLDGRLSRQAVTSGGNVVRVDPATGASDVDTGPAATIRFDGLAAGDKDVEIWLPYHERTEVAALRTDAPITVVPEGRRRWVHHGSSISQGSNAASPSTTWPALAAAQAGVDLVNLGFSGSALLDPFTARAIRDQRADVISVKLGINLVNADLLRQRAFGPAVHGFLDTIRDGHPDVPLVVIGPLYCPIHETTPGPGAFDVEALARGEVRFAATGDPADAARPGGLGRLTLGWIRDQLAAIVARRQPDDSRISYVDGLTLYGPADAGAHPLPDRLHPDAATHRVIAQRFAPALT
ncbi:GDSL-type esterase/lipase family protein [Mycolicibacterium sp. CAU 1645]|uniref:GDSL-type esterase/lipase family protein n=1 Tax=Mycolicibacterium arenosum TaxID=2952157 RepID=A0ABT1LUN3_9MYCO|nr:SGNH/GDSL hydrolase family protein [Mycolicibacterium sp. CAU 1645]MCP9270611.1 GDSL-type esterase/lipase family protein [Mycolicibacterium sp. CAU 1645]